MATRSSRTPPNKTAPDTSTSQRQNVRQQARIRAEQQQRRRRTLMIGAAGLAVALLAIGIFTVVSIMRVRDTNAADKASQQVGIAVPDEGRTHVAEGSTINYNSYPPASGNHYPSPTNAGFYPNPVPEGTFVHNLEHGYIVILYKPSLDAASQQQLRQAVQDFPKSKFGTIKLVVAPYDKMDTPITALAWDWKQPLDAFNRDQLVQFYRAHIDRGPEDLA